MDAVSIVNPEKSGDKYILRVDAWQLEEIRKGLERINKSRQYANSWVEKKRIEEGRNLKVKGTKTRLEIGDILSQPPTPSPPPSPPQITVSVDEEGLRESIKMILLQAHGRRSTSQVN